MSAQRARRRLWGGMATEAGLAVSLLVLVHAPREPSVSRQVAVAGGAVVGGGLFVLIGGREALRLRPVGRLRLPVFAVKTSVVLAKSASEEVVWRLVVLGRLLALAGAPIALAVSSVGFAASHWRLGRRGVAAHLVTGVLFGSIYLLTGRLAAAVAAHGMYNLLVAVGREHGVTALSPASAREAPRSVLPQPVAALDAVSKRFGDRHALKGLSLAVATGEVYALLGPNGAGKTTALGILLGLRTPDSGTARLLGRDPRKPAARRSIGVTPQETGLPQMLTVRETLDLVRAHFPAAISTADLIDRFGLADTADRRTGGLSGGEQRRVALALAFAGNPAAVFLDEPTSGLDVEARKSLWRAIRAYADGGGTVLLTTHYLEEAEALATRVGVLSDGRLVAEGTVEEVVSRVGRKRVSFHASDLPDLPGLLSLRQEGSAITIECSDADALIRRLIETGIDFSGLEVRALGLEEAFLELTKDPP